MVSTLGILAAVLAGGEAQDAPDIRSVPADLTVPEMRVDVPAAGRRVRQVLPGWQETQVYHALYLPTDYAAGKRYPVIVEFAGNGGFRSKWGDECTGRPEGCALGYGMSGGRGFIWVCAPFVSADRSRLALQWWGDKPDYDVRPTVDYCRELVGWVCRNWGGDADRVVIAGFSRGALACNYVGLHDDTIAGLWCGSVAYSHYDGVRRWSYPHSDRESAVRRLRRLGSRPQFVCHEASGNALAATRDWIEASGVPGRFTYVSTGFRNHSDAWVLRPSDARKRMRAWLAATVAR